MRTLLIFAGASKSGKTTLARRLAHERSIPYSSFSAAVRRRASERYPNEMQTIELLQNLGQEMVAIDACGFCREACGQALRNANACHVLDGLRHRRLIPILRALHPGYDLRIVFTEASKQARLNRFDPRISEAELEAIDSHVVEKDLSELRKTADLTLPTDCDEEDSYLKLVSWLSGNDFCEDRGSEDQGVNLRRGFLRLWVVFSLAWAVLVLAVSLGPTGRRDIVIYEQEKAASNLFSSRHVIPLSCGSIRGVRSLDYFEFRGRCWMALDTYRSLYPEDRATSDLTLAERTYAAVGQEFTVLTSWQRLWRILGILALGPLLTLGLGVAVHFIASGFDEDSLSVRGKPNKLWYRSGRFWLRVPKL